jgi:hypothetical protein
MRRRLVFVIVVAVVMIIVLIALEAALPLNGLASKAYVRDSDLIDYNVSGTAPFVPINGELSIEVSNVTVD